MRKVAQHGDFVRLQLRRGADARELQDVGTANHARGENDFFTCRNSECLATGGELDAIGLQCFAGVEEDLRDLYVRRYMQIGSVLRLAQVGDGRVLSSRVFIVHRSSNVFYSSVIAAVGIIVDTKAQGLYGVDKFGRQCRIPYVLRDLVIAVAVSQKCSLEER